MPGPDFANSFGRAVDAYDSARPGYPREAIEWMLPADATTVLDLGAGTGKFTRQLVDAGYDTIAVEPDAAMLARLESTLPGVRALLGAAESIPLADDSVDAVTSAQAWHWVDPARALPEVARILRPGGAFAAVWNVLDGTVPWVVALSEAVGGRRNGGVETVLVADESFTPVESTVIPWRYVLDREGVLRLVSSWSQYIVAAPDERARILSAVGQVLDEHPDVAGLDSYPLAYNARCFRARRTP